MRINVAGGIESNIKEMDAKKKGIKPNPPLKLTVAKGPALLEFCQTSAASASTAKDTTSPVKKVSSSTKPATLKGMRPTTAKTSQASQKK